MSSNVMKQSIHSTGWLIRVIKISLDLEPPFLGDHFPWFLTTRMEQTITGPFMDKTRDYQFETLIFYVCPVSLFKLYSSVITFQT